MAYYSVILAMQMASVPYYLADQTELLTTLQAQVSNLKACRPEGDKTIGIDLQIDSEGIPKALTMSENNGDACLSKHVLEWRFPAHYEDLETFHFSLSIRKGQYYLLPGSYVIPREIGLRYWMRPPVQSVDDQALPEQSESKSIESE